MSRLMTVKEYARHVDADPRTVRRWMRDGLLEFTPPPKEHSHYARLIDSNQPRPKPRRKRRSAKATDRQSEADAAKQAREKEARERKAADVAKQQRQREAADRARQAREKEAADVAKQQRQRKAAAATRQSREARAAAGWKWLALLGLIVIMVHEKSKRLEQLSINRPSRQPTFGVGGIMPLP